MITINVENFNVVKESKDLIQEHWDEIAQHDGLGREFDMDWELLETFEKLGRLITIIARDNGKAVGYATFIMQNHFHAKNALCAHCDALFLSKSSRKGLAGYKLLKESKDILSKLYPNVIIMWHVTTLRDFSKILIKLGYRKFETIYALSVGV